LGWSPFDNGGWAFDPVFGWSFIGSQPWGWLPFHYGGWAFQPGLGWAWSTCGFGPGLGWLPSTGVFVRRRRGPIGVIPIHPLDKHGRAPRNLVHGVFPVERGVVGRTLQPAEGKDWEVVRKAPAETLSGNLVRTGAPQVTSRLLTGGAAGGRGSIAFDAHGHRFVNANGGVSAGGAVATGGVVSQRVVANNGAAKTATSGRTGAPLASGRGGNAPPRGMTPPPARSSGGGSYSGRGSRGGGWSGGGGSSSHPSTGGGSSGGASHPSGGGRPH